MFRYNRDIRKVSLWETKIGGVNQSWTNPCVGNKRIEGEENPRFVEFPHFPKKREHLGMGCR